MSSLHSFRPTISPQKANQQLIHARGFSVLATLAILSLVVLIALAMLSLSETAMRTSAHRVHIEQARGNARLALANALSVMQEEIGPDQRVTAWSNILDTNPSTVQIEGVPNPYFLGAWNSWNRYLNEDIKGVSIQETYTLGRDTTLTGSKKSTDRFRRWLVSGGEDPMAYSNLARSGDTVVKLIGDQTLGGDRSDTSDDHSHVYAELKDIYTKGKRSGGYAWWVGGENLKASLAFSSRPPISNHTDVQAFSGQLSHFDTSHDDTIDSFPGNENTRDKVTTYKTTELMLGDVGQLKDFKQNYFSYTGPTTGLFTNTKLGGTQVDLSLAFEANPKYPPTDLFGARGEVNYDGSLVGTPIRPWGGSLPKPHNPNTYPSCWGRLFGYHHLYRSYHADNSWPGVEWDEYGIPYTRRVILWDDREPFERGSQQNTLGTFGYSRFPVVVRYSWIFGVRTIPNTEDSAKRDVLLTGHPVIVLWNPYNVEMRIPSTAISVNYRFVKSLIVQSKIYINGSQKQNWRGLSQTPDREKGGNQSLSHSVDTPDEMIVIPPGETKLFTLHSESEASSNLYAGYDPSLPHLSGLQTPIKSITGLEKSDKVQIALRLGENNSIRSMRPIDCYWWSMNKSGFALRIGDTSAKDKNGVGDGLYKVFGGVETARNRFSRGIWIDWIENETEETTGHRYNRTQIVRDDPYVIPYADMYSSSIVPIGIFSVTMKSMEEPLYTDATPTSPKPAAAGDFRNKNWLFAPPTNLMLVMQNPTDLYRSAFSHQISWEEVTSNIALGDMIQVDKNDRAYIGGGTSPANGVVKFVSNELPTAPITSLAGYGSVPLVPAAVRIPSETHLDGLSHLLSFKTAIKSNGHTTMNFGMGVGNGYAHPMIPLGQVYHDTERVNSLTQVKEFSDHWDSLFLSNDGLWDNYFTSTILPRTEKGQITRTAKQVLTDYFDGKEQLYCHRIKLLAPPSEPILRDLQQVSTDEDGLVIGGGYSKAGKYFGIDGSFNINSTSVQAWRSLLYGLKSRQFPYLMKTGESGVLSVPEKVVISRTRHLSDTREPTHASDPSVWTGVRYLTDPQLDRLAEEIVKQVKLRGPFLNMAEFMNRRLDSRDQNIPQTHYKYSDLSNHSALQAAIDWDEFNQGYNGSIDTSPYTLQTGMVTTHQESSINALFKSPNDMFDANINLPTAVYPNPKAAHGSRFSGLPTYVMPSDLLQGVGNLMRPRCDTFTIRAYGCCKDKAGNVLAEAYCEATVQRSINYIDPKDENQKPVNDPFGKDLGLSEINKQHGRELRVTGFKWLTKSEI